MSFIFPVAPFPDESLVGLVVRATAVNLRRHVIRALHRVGIFTSNPDSLCYRPADLAKEIAEFVGSLDIGIIAAKFHSVIAGDRSRIDFFGEPLRKFYRDTTRRRVSPRALKNGEYVRAIWSLRPFSFDPSTKERLIDACPVCCRPLGWTRTYGIAFCDQCSRTEGFLGATWKYPRVDLRDFPQRLVEVNDIEALDFVTGLIDPFPGRKDAARRLLPEMWAGLSNGEIFEVVLSFASMQGAVNWDKYSSRRPKSGGGWEKFTPEVLATAGRAIIGGKLGLEQFGDLLRLLGQNKRRVKSYGRISELGPLGAVDPYLSAIAREVLERGVSAYFLSLQDPDLKPIIHLGEKYGVPFPILSALARSGLVPSRRFDHLEKAPVLMSEAAVISLLREGRDAISGTMAASRIGIHVMYLGELERGGLLDRVEGPVLKLLGSDVYYTRQSLELLEANLAENAPRRRIRDAVKLSVALRALGVQDVPWAAIVSAIVEGRLRGLSVKSKGFLGERLAIANVLSLTEVIHRALEQASAVSAEWISKAVAAEILGTNMVAVGHLVNTGMLTQHHDTPMYSPCRRVEVLRLSKRVIFTPEIVRTGRFQTYREASIWLREEGIAPLMELKRGGWKLYARVEVERVLKRRLHAMIPKAPPRLSPPRPTGVLHGSERPRSGVAREPRNPSRVDELLGQPFGTYPRQIKKRLLEMVKHGASVRQASLACGVNYSTARGWTKR